MDAKEFGTALFNEYFINETHAIRILESCHGGPTNWSSIQWTIDESAKNNTDTGAGLNIFTALLDDSSPGAPVSGDEVLGMSVFWILLPLCLACVYHPLASSIHNHSRFRMYFHVSVLFCCLDIFFMAIQCFAVRAQHPISWRRVAEVVVNHRLKAFLSPGGANEQSTGVESGSLPHVQGANPSGSRLPTEAGQRETIATSSSTADPVADRFSDTIGNQRLRPALGRLASSAPTDVVAQAALNIYVRLIADALNILLYAKICGFSGIRPWSIVADCFFNCWLLMELFLFVGYYAAPRQRPDLSAESAYSATLAVESNDLTPSTEASALTPLFVELSVSIFAIYYTVGTGLDIGNFCLHAVEWYVNQPGKYLVEIPFGFAWSLSHPLFLPGVVCAAALLAVWLSGLIIVWIVGGVAFLGLPVCYASAFALIFGACRRLARRYHRQLRISDSTLNIICARILVAVICAHYLVYFLWLYDSQGTKKASWTEMLGRRLG